MCVNGLSNTIMATLCLPLSSSSYAVNGYILCIDSKTRRLGKGMLIILLHSKDRVTWDFE